MLRNATAGKTVSAAYVLEYGEDKIEMHVDAVKPGQRVVLIDDLVATGGTAAAGTFRHPATAAAAAALVAARVMTQHVEVTVQVSCTAKTRPQSHSKH